MYQMNWENKTLAVVKASRVLLFKPKLQSTPNSFRNGGFEVEILSAVVLSFLKLDWRKAEGDNLTLQRLGNDGL